MGAAAFDCHRALTLWQKWHATDRNDLARSLNWTAATGVSWLQCTSINPVVETTIKVFDAQANFGAPKVF